MESKTRRRAGFLLGALLGLVYTFVAQNVNNWAMPDVPLYVPPPGKLGIILLGAFLFGLMGLAAAWPEDAIPGVIVSALFGSVLTSFWSLYTQPDNRISAFILLFLVFLPRLFFYAPPGALVRWIISRREDVQASIRGSSRKLVNAVAISLVLAAAGGAFSLHSKEIRQALELTDRLVEKGMQASTRPDIPAPLRTVNGFFGFAIGDYTLDVGLDPDVLPVQRPIAAYGVTETLVVIRFQNGYYFGCVFTPPSETPVCGNFLGTVR